MYQCDNARYNPACVAVHSFHSLAALEKWQKEKQKQKSHYLALAVFRKGKEISFSSHIALAELVLWYYDFHFLILPN